MPRYTYYPNVSRPQDTLFAKPPVDTDIWRYFPLRWFIALLESRRLFLSRVGRLEDEFEGSAPYLSEQELRVWEEKYLSAENRAQFRLNRERAREIIVVNCWQMSKYESVLMWQQYVPGWMGVAVKSTFGRLGAAFDQHPDNGRSSIEDIDISKVRYIDYARDQFRLSNTFNYFIHKRMEYEPERELRVLAMITTGAIDGAAAGENDYQITEAGLLLPVSLKTLVEAIYIPPRAPAVVEQTVRDRLKGLGLESIPVRPSRLREKPIY